MPAKTFYKSEIEKVFHLQMGNLIYHRDTTGKIFFLPLRVLFPSSMQAKKKQKKVLNVVKNRK